MSHILYIGHIMDIKLITETIETLFYNMYSTVHIPSYDRCIKFENVYLLFAEIFLILLILF